MITAQGTVPFPQTDPQAVEAFGTTVASLVQALRAACTQLQQVSSVAAGAWQGEAADAFQSHLTGETAALSSLAQHLTSVQPALGTFTARMTDAQARYEAAVQQQQAAIAEGAAGLADEAAAIVAEGLAVAELEAAGALCAGSLAGAGAGLVTLFSPAELVEMASDVAKGLTGAAHEVVDDMTKVVAGYTRRSGAVVDSYVRYAEGLGKRYASELKASTLREAGDLAGKASVAAKWLGNTAVGYETYERDRELVKQGVPEPYAAAEAAVGRIGPAVAGAAAGTATEGAIEGAGAAAGGAAGSVVPVAGTAAGAVEGAVAASIPAVVAGTAVNYGVTKGGELGADWITDRVNELAFHIKPEGPAETVPPPNHPPGS